MSIVRQLGKNLEHFDTIMEGYEKELLEAKPRLELKGKTLEDANKEQASWRYYYDARKSELSVLVEHFEKQVARVRARLFKGLEKYPRDLSDRAKDKYIDQEADYLDMYNILLEVREMYTKYSALVSAFEARGWALRNVTEIHIHNIRENTL